MKICAAPGKAVKDDEVWAKLDNYREHIALLIQLDETISVIKTTDYWEQSQVTAIKSILCGKSEDHIDWKYAQPDAPEPTV